MAKRAKSSSMRFWTILLVALAIFCIFLWQFCWPMLLPSGPVKPKYVPITDMTGRIVNVPALVSRVVVLQSHWAEIVCLLGADDKVVGVSKDVEHSVWIPSHIKSKAIVGDLFSGVDLEKIVALEPDVVITDTGYGRAEDVIKGLESRGIPVIRMSCQDFNDLLKAIRIIGTILNASTKAEEVVGYLTNEFDRVKSIVSMIPEGEKPKVLVLSSVEENLVSLCANGFWNKLVEDVGGINIVLRNASRQVQLGVDIRVALSWNPEIIIVISTDKEIVDKSIQSLKSILENTTALHSLKGVHGVLAGSKDEEAFIDLSPRLLIGYIQLAKIIQPNYFKDLDWRKEANDLLMKFYHVRKYVTVKDVRGKEVTLRYPVERAAVLMGYSFVAPLGAFDKVVGIHDGAKSDWIMQKVVPNIRDIPSVSSGGMASSVNIEMLLALKPDVVITWDGYPDVIEKIESVGIPVVAIHPRNLTGIKETFLLLGTIFGREEKAKELVSLIDYVVDFVRNRTKGIPEDQRLRALYLYSPLYRGSPYVWGWGTTVSQAFEPAGLVDVTKGRMPPPGYGGVTLETIARWNPDIIFLAPRPWCRCTAEDIYKDPAWQGINAVKNRRVYQLPLMSSWSPDFALLSLYYATKAYPELFKDINFDEFYKEFTKKVFGISLEPYYGG